jgi:hypothetical protein
MKKKNTQCSHAGLGRMTALRAQQQRSFDGVIGSRRRTLGDDDDTVGPGMAQVIGIVGSGMAWGAHDRRLGEDDVVVGSGTASRAWG